MNQNGLARLDSRSSSLIEQPVLATDIRIRFLCVKLHCEVDAFKSLVINYFSVWESAEWKTKWFDHERNKKADKNQDKVARIKKSRGIYCLLYDLALALIWTRFWPGLILFVSFKNEELFLQRRKQNGRRVMYLRRSREIIYVFFSSEMRGLVLCGSASISTYSLP